MKNKMIRIWIWITAGVVPLFGQATDYYPVPDVDPPGQSEEDQAAQVSQPAEGGIQLALVDPQGDLRGSLNGRTGFSLGAHGAVPMGAGLEMRPRFDFTRMDGGAFSMKSLDSTLTLEGLGVGADILTYGDSDRTGPYAFAGANLTLWYAKSRFDSNTKGVYPGLSVGVGGRLTTSFSSDLQIDYGRFRPGVGIMEAIRLVIYYRFAPRDE